MPFEKNLPHTSSNFLTFQNIILCALIALITFFITLNLVLTSNLIHEQVAFVDYNFFYLIGKLGWTGELAKSYDANYINQTIFSKINQDLEFLWLYPPNFAVLLSILSLLPYELSYLIFIVPALIGYLILIKIFAGKDSIIIYVITLPAILMNIVVGQNGFIFAILFGLFAVANSKNSPLDGAYWGLIFLKPHLAITHFLFLIVTRRWESLLIGLCVIIITTGLSIYLFGIEAWLAFLKNLDSLIDDNYKGLTSISFASISGTLYSWGISLNSSFYIQLLSSLTICGVIIIYSKKKLSSHQILGLSTIGTNGISPHILDYDMLISGIGLSLLWPTIIKYGGYVERGIIILTALLLSGFYNWFQAGLSKLKFGFSNYNIINTGSETVHFISISGLAFWILFATTLLILNRSTKM